MTRVGKDVEKLKPVYVVMATLSGTATGENSSAVSWSMPRYTHKKNENIMSIQKHEPRAGNLAQWHSTSWQA